MNGCVVKTSNGKRDERGFDKKKMKKLLVFLVMFSFMFGVGIVMAGNLTVGVNGTGTSVTISEENIAFGNVLPSGIPVTAPAFNITADVENNMNISIDVNVTGVLFVNGLKFDGVLAMGRHYDINCNPGVNLICGYIPIEINPTLDVPVGTMAGAQTGVIIYTITGVTP